MKNAIPLILFVVAACGGSPPSSHTFVRGSVSPDVRAGGERIVAVGADGHFSSVVNARGDFSLPLSPGKYRLLLVEPRSAGGWAIVGHLVNRTSRGAHRAIALRGGMLSLGSIHRPGGDVPHAAPLGLQHEEVSDIEDDDMKDDDEICVDRDDGDDRDNVELEAEHDPGDAYDDDDDQDGRDDDVDCRSIAPPPAPKAPLIR